MSNTRRDSDSQRKATTQRRATQSLQLSQVNAERDKGAAAEAWRIILQAPDVVESQNHSIPVDTYCDYNTQNYNNAMEWDNDPDWVAVQEEGNVDNNLTKALKEIRYIYRDFCTRRDRMQISNKHWAPQLDEMVDAYMDFCCRVKAGNLREGEEDATAMVLEVIDVFAMDSNDSLKRVKRKEDILQEREDAGEDLPAASKECIDCQTAGEDYFVSWAETAKWDERGWESLQLPQGDPSAPPENFWADSGCEEKWQNMDEKKTAKETLKFFENGWFVLLCRHMIMILACNMVRSSKLYQYPLALLAIYMIAKKEERERNREGPPKGKLANAYDMHCKFSKHIKCSPLKLIAKWSKYLPVIGTMHGYAHNWQCQLLFLMLYIIGIGIEDGKSISKFIYYQDLQPYSNISKFIYGNYKQALSIVQEAPVLQQSMLDAGINSPNVFFKWLMEEGEYLQSLSWTLLKETLESEYYLRLEALKACQDHLQKARKAWLSFLPGVHVHALEEKLAIQICWSEGSEKWEEAKKAVKEIAYRKALDKLEGLLVAQVFEMSCLNVMGTGYKLWKHIANTMKIHSKTISAAIIFVRKRLNMFTFQSSIFCKMQERKWATPGNQLIMTRFFKLIRTEEEICRLHMEIQRLITHMFDKEDLILNKAEDMELENPGLVLQLRSYWNEQGKFNKLHHRHLFAIKKLPGFQPENIHYFRQGTHVSQEDTSMGPESLRGHADARAEPDESAEPWVEDEDGGDEEDEILLDSADAVMNLTVDE
ncbi:hypothetical protein BDP27DRAFT_1424740 [Rhodocollybia butyracea]|uniref:Uncharacterized protein n=1 Tax=Rhodocollybia butyracea TaxID=206335 RepID=A0A9P5U430_9AGAR|nr:hypothetical protein BDP27DRAFT_1424740 [Rhodocollybia butyracea]